MVENSNFIKCLRNVHLEKSAVTGLFHPSCSPTTAKTPAKVHLRLRFQNRGKPRTAGLCGRAAGACDCGPLSCAKIERPSPLEKPSCKVRLFAQNRSRKYRQKVTAITLFQTASHHDFQLRSQTAHVCLHGRKRVHTRLSEKNRTQRLTRRNRGLPSLGHSTVLSCQRNSFYSTVLLYTYISRFSVNPQHQQKRIIRQSYHHKFYPQPLFIAFFNFSSKWPTFAFTSESGYTLGFRRRIAHKCSQGETGVCWMGALSLPSERFTRFGNPAWPGGRTAYFAASGS